MCKKYTKIQGLNNAHLHKTDLPPSFYHANRHGLCPQHAR